MKTIMMAAVALLALAPAAHAADEIKIGLLTQLSGPISPSGTEIKRGFDVAMEELGGKIGGIPAKVFVADDKSTPAEAVQAASKLIYDDKVDVVTGLGASNTLIPVYKSFVDAGVILIGALAGPARYAGKECNPNAFFLSFQNDDFPMGMAKYMNEHGVKKAVFIGADYQAGYEHVGAAMRAFKGEKIGPIYMPLTQLDFSAELARIRAAKPDGIFAFVIGPEAVAFVKQYAQAGLKNEIPFYTEDPTANPLTFQAEGDAALGLIEATNWNPDLDNPANKKFVAEFRKKYGRDPASFAALQYDAVKLLDSAVRAVHGNISDKAALRAALKKADFQSVRGPFKFNNNNFPIQNIYVEKVVKNKEGALHLAFVDQVAANWQDPYHQECKMK
jgi:branched-chain amino acid transport system substrate-binding protein